jgi:hypothetical protein
MDYLALRTTAKSLISQFGGNIRIVPAAGAAMSTKAVKVSVKQEGQTTTETEAFLVSGALSRAPQVGDKIETGALVFHITSVEVVSPGGTSLLYKCYV